MSNVRRIKITDENPQGENFSYLRPEKMITYTRDRTYNIPLIEIQLVGWFESIVRLWPKNARARSSFLLLGKTPPSSPSISFHLKLELTRFF